MKLAEFLLFTYYKKLDDMYMHYSDEEIMRIVGRRLKQNSMYNYMFYVTQNKELIEDYNISESDNRLWVSHVTMVARVLKIGDFYIAFDDRKRGDTKWRQSEFKKLGWELIPKKYHNMQVKEVEVA